MTTEHVDARPALASALVTAIDHVGIAVPDLDVAIKWYHDHLGMIVLHEEINVPNAIIAGSNRSRWSRSQRSASTIRQ